MRGATHISLAIFNAVPYWVLYCEVVVKESSMKQIRMLAQYYVDLMMKLDSGALFILWRWHWWCWRLSVRMAVTMVLHGQVNIVGLSFWPD